MDKLECLGVRGGLLKWFESYLSNRKQYVSISGSCSETKTINNGVPQGSTLGPLLFLVYINDMHLAINRLQTVHFADDTTLSIAGRDLDELVQVTNAELARVDAWLQCNRLSLNINKTHFTIFSNKNKTMNDSIKIRGVNIEQKKCVKFLGVLIDDRLSFSNHIQHVIGKVSKSCGMLHKLKNYVTAELLRSIYYALVYPYLNYAISVWGASSLTCLSKLCKLQDRCIKNVGQPDGPPVCGLYELLKILPLKDIYKYSILIKFFQYKTQQNNLHFYLKLCEIDTTHDHNTRLTASAGLRMPAISKAICSRSFFVQAVGAWNSLPGAIRLIEHPTSFRSALRNHLLNNLNTV